MIDVVTLALAKSFTNKAVLGSAGAITGDSAYEVWLGTGNTGSVNDFFESLRGEQGVDGEIPEFRVIVREITDAPDENVMQYRFLINAPDWKDFYVLPSGDVPPVEEGNVAVGSGTSIKDSGIHIDDKLDKVTSVGGRRVYVVNPDGTQDTEIIVSNSPEANSIPQRNTEGTFPVGDPVNPQEPVTLKYFEENIGDGVVNVYNIDDIDGAITNGTSLQFNQSIANKISAGSMVTGTVYFTDLPQSMAQAEIVIFVSTGNQLQHKSFLFSQDVKPGLWSATGYFSSGITWREGGGGIDSALFIQWKDVGAQSGVAPLDGDSKVPLANLPDDIGGNFVKNYAHIDVSTGLELNIRYTGDIAKLLEEMPRLSQVILFYSTIKTTGTYSLPDGNPVNFKEIAQGFVEAEIISMAATFGALSMTFSPIAAINSADPDYTEVSGIFTRPSNPDEEALMTSPSWELKTYVDTDGILKVDADFSGDVRVAAADQFLTFLAPGMATRTIEGPWSFQSASSASGTYFFIDPAQYTSIVEITDIAGAVTSHGGTGHTWSLLFMDDNTEQVIYTVVDANAPWNFSLMMPYAERMVECLQNGARVGLIRRTDTGSRSLHSSHIVNAGTPSHITFNIDTSTGDRGMRANIRLVESADVDGFEVYGKDDQLVTFIRSSPRLEARVDALENDALIHNSFDAFTEQATPTGMIYRDQNGNMHAGMKVVRVRTGQYNSSLTDIGSIQEVFGISNPELIDVLGSATSDDGGKIVCHPPAILESGRVRVGVNQAVSEIQATWRFLFYYYDNDNILPN